MNETHTHHDAEAKRGFDSRLICLLGWFLGLIWLLLDKRYTAFIREDFWPLLAVGAAGVFIFLVCVLLSKHEACCAHHHHHGENSGIGRWLQIGFVMLPMVFALSNINQISFDSAAFAKRWVDPSKAVITGGSSAGKDDTELIINIDKAAELTEETGDEKAGDENVAVFDETSPAYAIEFEEVKKGGDAETAPAVGPQSDGQKHIPDAEPIFGEPTGVNVEEVAVGPDGSKTLTLLDIVNNEKILMGQKVKTIGRAFVEAGMPEAHLVAFRFAMTCCAADATPVGLIVHSKAEQMPENDAWVEITGVVGVKTLEGLETMVLMDTVIKKVDAPDNPYLQNPI